MWSFLTVLVIIAFLCCAGVAVIALLRSPTPRSARPTVVVPAGGLSELDVYPTDSDVFVRKLDGTLAERPNDLEEMCKDWLFYRNQILKHNAAGRTNKADEARRDFQTVNSWLNAYSEEDVVAMFEILEVMGYEPP